MENENNLVKVMNEEGKTFNMLILNEFEHKNKKYAILTEIDGCHCEEECDCDDECSCDEHCDCGCQEGKECTCEGECNCGCNHDEPMLTLLEITKDKDGNEIFKSIDDEKLFNELVEKADKILYKD